MYHKYSNLLIILQDYFRLFLKVKPKSSIVYYIYKHKVQKRHVPPVASRATCLRWVGMLPLSRGTETLDNAMSEASGFHSVETLDC